MTIREAISQAAADLKFAEIESPNLDASILLSHVLNKDRSSLITCAKQRLPEEACAALCALIERRCNGECVAYITGKKEFWGLEFDVNKSVLVPRPETETLVEIALKQLETRNEETGINVLDLCTGSGAIAISLKNEMPQLEVDATDICSDALETAKNNSKKLLGDKKINFYLGDLFDALPHCALPAAYSLIISNPPYIPSEKIKTLSAEVQNEPYIALNGGEAGLKIIRRLIEKSTEYLIKGGSLLLEADPNQMEEIKNILIKKGYVKIKIYKDMAGHDRVIRGNYET